jgi:primosomal protein N' (replication factor Y)
MYADVAVCLPLSRTFVYKLNEPVAAGCRVVVPFRKRDIEGFVVGLREEPPEGVEVHPVRSVLDAEPLIRPDIFELCRWISDYYLAPPGEVFKSALPPGIRLRGERSERKPDRAQRVKDAAGEGEEKCRHACSPSPSPLPEGEGFALSSDQSRALHLIQHSPGFHTVLLHGVTGSGKTEIYLRAAQSCLARGKTSLILVPEIGLTPQLTERFAERFPGRTAVLHSGLTRRQRIDEWFRIFKGEAPVVIGTRSAVFAPLSNIGLIVVDEEHEASYKQEELPRYNARDTAVFRAKIAGATAILGSATPSMESFHNAESGKYSYLGMPGRVEDRPMPDVETVNMREECAVSFRPSPNAWSAASRRCCC